MLLDRVNTSARGISRVLSGSSKKGVWADCLKRNPGLLVARVYDYTVSYRLAST